ncbi:MAG: transcriptional regulator, AbrB family [Nonomuraea muscovyensis]|nr:transcriptional regulator, AbrB family [Nonomuraea muscovyensis]
MKINSKGQVTIPARLRAKHNLHEGDEVEVIEVSNVLQIVRREDSLTRGQRLVEHMRGRGKGTMTTDEIMKMMRGDDWGEA